MANGPLGREWQMVRLGVSSKGSAEILVEFVVFHV